MIAQIQVLAGRLDAARRSGNAIAQLSASHDLDLNDAYAVQRVGIAMRVTAGERVVGAKLGFTSKAKAEQMGVDDVIFGVLTDAMSVPDGGSLDLSRAIHPRIEPEVAFRLRQRIRPGPSAVDAKEAIDAVAPALEVIDSRYRDFKFSLTDVVADNTSASAYVIGPWQPLVPGSDFALIDRAVTLRFDGAEVASGSTTDILDDPFNALPAVLRLANLYDVELPAGAVVLAGAATAAAALRSGVHVTADVAGLGQVSLRTTGKNDG